MKKLCVVVLLVSFIFACNQNLKKFKYDIAADSNCVTMTVCPD